MNNQLLFAVFFLSALDGGNFGVLGQKNTIYTGVEGRYSTIKLHVYSSGNTKFLCKNTCGGKDDILIKTEDAEAKNGSYTLRYRPQSSTTKSLSVTFSPLTKSHAGRYRCGLGGPSAPDSYRDIEIRVSDEVPLDGNSDFIRTDTVGGRITRGCTNTVYGSRKFFCKGHCKREGDILIDTSAIIDQKDRYSLQYKQGSMFGLYVTITDLAKSDTGQYSCGYGDPTAPDSISVFNILVVDALTALTTSASIPQTTDVTVVSSDPGPGYFWPLVVSVLLVVVVLLVGFLLVIYTRWRRRRNSDLELPVTYENMSPASTAEDTIYQSLDPASRDQNQTYYHL